MDRILITAATGRTGRATAKLLLERGLSVRALVRKEDERSKELVRLGAEIVTGDLRDFDSLRAAMKDVSRAYFVFPIGAGLIESTAYFAQAALDAGIEAIVNMSQISAREDAKSHVAQNHWIAERLLDRTGIATTHLRPTFFAEWFLYYPAMIKSGVIRFPFRRGRHAPIAVSDQARVIAAILQNPEPHKGMTYQLFGAVEMDHSEIARQIGIALAHPNPHSLNAALKDHAVHKLEEAEHKVKISTAKNLVGNLHARANCIGQNKFTWNWQAACLKGLKVNCQIAALELYIAPQSNHQAIGPLK